LRIEEFYMKILIPFLLLLGLIPTIGNASQSKAIQTKAEKEPIYSHYLDRIFGIESRFHQLPKDVQYIILSFLPNPFRPLKPRKIRGITYKSSSFMSYLKPTFTKSGKEIFFCTSDGFFLEALDGSYRTDSVIFDHGINSYALNDDHTKMVIISANYIHEITLDNYTVIDKHSVASPDVKMFHFAKVRYMPNGTIIIVTDCKEVFRWDPTTPNIEKLTKTPSVENSGAGLETDHCIHPQGLNVIFAGENHLSVFDLVKKEWSTINADTLNLSGEARGVVYNTDGSKLLVKDYTKSLYYGKPIIDGKNIRPRPLYQCFALIRVYDFISGTPKAIGKPITGSNFYDIGFTADGAFIYGQESYSGQMKIYSAETQNCLLALSKSKNVCLIDPNKKHFVTMRRRRTKAKNPFIWEANPSWVKFDSFVGRKNTLRQYFFIAFLQSLGDLGLSINKKGLYALPKRAKRFLIVNGGPDQEELSQIVEVYNSFEEPAQEYFHNKYHALDNLKGSKVDLIKALKLLTLIAIIGYTGNIVKNKYAPKKGNKGSRFLGGFLVEIEKI